MALAMVLEVLFLSLVFPHFIAHLNVHEGPQGIGSRTRGNDEVYPSLFARSSLILRALYQE